MSRRRLPVCIASKTLANALFSTVTRVGFASRPSCRICGSRRAKRSAYLPEPIRAASTRWAFCNVLGFLSRKSDLRSFETQERITAQFVLDSIEALAAQLSGPIVLVLDNASVHRSKLVQAKRREWKRKGWRLVFLPPYCPHLNLIETLWRQTKYRWLDCEAYQNFGTLCRSVTNILAQVGAKYQLSFA